MEGYFCERYIYKTIKSSYKRIETDNHLIEIGDKTKCGRYNKNYKK